LCPYSVYRAQGQVWGSSDQGKEQVLSGEGDERKTRRVWFEREERGFVCLFVLFCLFLWDESFKGMFLKNRDETGQ